MKFHIIEYKINKIDILKSPLNFFHYKSLIDHFFPCTWALVSSLHDNINQTSPR